MFAVLTTTYAIKQRFRPPSARSRSILRDLYSGTGADRRADRDGRSVSRLSLARGVGLVSDRLRAARLRDDDAVGGAGATLVTLGASRV